jgi:hypothetical protein
MMKTIYLDYAFRCHTEKPLDFYREVETDFFDGKCDAFIEGYRFIPEGESWTRTDGTVFYGEMIAPWKDYAQLDAAQREYEKEQLADAENALGILLGGEFA